MGPNNSGLIISKRVRRLTFGKFISFLFVCFFGKQSFVGRWFDPLPNKGSCKYNLSL